MAQSPPLGTPMQVVLRTLELADMDPDSWARRSRLSREHSYVMAEFKLTDPQEGIRLWIVISLMIRVPTTVISYAATMVSAVLGGASRMDVTTRTVLGGLRTLYGTRAWYLSAPDITPCQLRLLVESRSLDPWVRARADLEYHSVSRDADLTYLEPDDVTLIDDYAQISFRFLKNDASGTFGVIKIAKLLDLQNFRDYHALAVANQWQILFPQRYDAFLRAVRTVLPEIGTRGFRRGAAVAATAVATPMMMKSLLGHKNEGTQRTYTRRLTAGEVMEQRRIQTCLHNRTDTSANTEAHPYTASLRTPGASKTTTNPPTSAPRNLTLIPSLESTVGSSLIRMAMEAAQLMEVHD